MADAISGESGVGVRGVFVPSQPDPPEQVLDLFPADVEHGPQQMPATFRYRAFGAHACHAAEPRATHKAYEKRLQLIVRVVPGGDERAVVLFRESVKQLIPGHSCVRFEIVWFVANLDVTMHERHPPPLRKVGYMRCLRIGL